MDKVVRVFTGGPISQMSSDVDFGGMEVVVLLFRESLDFRTLLTRIKLSFGWDEPGVIVRLQGRYDASVGCKVHVYLLPILSDNDWDMYKDLVLAYQV